jgi:Ca-activated chloride channel family protein
MSRYLSIALIALLVSTEWTQEQRITVNVDLVNIYFTVCNKKQRPIVNLDRNNFSVLEDGKPQSITNFSRETDVPLTLAVLIDTSGSVRHKLAFERDAIIDFLNTTLRPGLDKATILTFDSDVQLRQDYTNDAALLATAVKGIRAGGGTRLYDALHFVVDSLNSHDDRKVLIVVTDGDDKSSRYAATDVIELAQRNNVGIYAISVNGLDDRPDGSDASDRILETIALETGGIGLFPTKPKKLIADFDRINNELHSRYTLAYRSTNPNRDGTFRRIEIISKNNQYAVRSRSGYYAPQAITNLTREHNTSEN